MVQTDKQKRKEDHKNTRMSIRHPLRKLSNENWGRYGRMRYRVEQLFGSIKQKIGSSFKLLGEDLARKASVACAILWNFWVLATYLFLLFLSVWYIAL